jgi:hypothetical protein
MPKPYRARLVRSSITGDVYYDRGNVYIRRSDYTPFEAASFLTGDLDYIGEVEVSRSIQRAIQRALDSL